MNKVYACSDLHGVLDLWKQIDKFTDDTDIIYFLGDGGDRGPQGWATIKALARSPKVIYLKGNHEDMTSKAMFEVLDDGMPGLNYHLSCNNGGQLTIEDALSEENNRIWARWLRDLPTYSKYQNKDKELIILSHAGFNLEIDDATGTLKIPSDDELIFNRNHINTLIRDDRCSTMYAVFGHTPIQVINNCAAPGALYLPGNKICIDNGAFFSGKCCLFDLDTFDENIFEVGKESISPIWR